MRIYITNVFVDDQQKALRFYTQILGFEKKHEIPIGQDFWLTVVSPNQPDGPELLLEPDGHPAAREYKQALYADGIPAASFAVDDLEAEQARLIALGVKFVQSPTDVGNAIVASFDDTCGNLIQLVEMKA